MLKLLLLTIIFLGVGFFSSVAIEGKNLFGESTLSPAKIVKTKHVRLTLISDYSNYALQHKLYSGTEASTQQPFRFNLGLQFDIKKKWHLYWKNPGDSGLPITVTWLFSDEDGNNFNRYFNASPIKWPTPHRIEDSSFLTTFGYEDDLLLTSSVVLTEEGKRRFVDLPQKLIVQAQVNWLVCKEVCLRQQGVVFTTLWKAKNSDALQKQKTAFQKIQSIEKKLPYVWNNDSNNNLAINLFVLKTENANKRIATNIMVRLSLNKKNSDSTNSENLLGLEWLNRALSKNKQLDFFPTEAGILKYERPAYAFSEQKTVIYHQWLIALEKPLPKNLTTIQMVVTSPEENSFSFNNKITSIQVTLPIQQAVDSVKTSSFTDFNQLAQQHHSGGKILSLSKNNYRYIWMFLYAFIGGMLLNLMPCVFPVLFIKIMGFAEQKNKSWHERMLHASGYAAGILLTFWVLVATLLILKSGGTQIGWGFHLQSPTFIGILVLVFFLFGLNLSGVFEVGVMMTRLGGLQAGGLQAGGSQLSTKKANKYRFGSSLFSGVLATVVATPCTAPFMGASLGLALTLNWMMSLLTFTFLGLGMAAPYVVLVLYPFLLKLLPKPGGWMASIKQFLAFPMYAVMIALIWLLSRQLSSSVWLPVAIALFLASMAAWIYGKWSKPHLRLKVRFISFLFSGILIAASIYYLSSNLLAMKHTTNTSLADNTNNGTVQLGQQDNSDLVWQSYSSAMIEKFRVNPANKHRAIFVNFTADWCINCKINERVVLQNKRVREAFLQQNVLLVKGDWTLYQPDITAALESFGRSGVPLYVFYPPPATTEINASPKILPEVLTPNLILNLFK